MAQLKSTERAAFIKTGLKIKRTSFSAIARSEDLAPTTVAAVARGTVKSKRIETLLADILGLSREELRPEHYKKEN